MKPIPELSAVTPLADFLCFEVASQTTPGVTYRVDKTLWFGSGACSCEEFCCRVQPRLGRGDWSGPNICKHIQATDTWIARKVTRTAIEQRLAGKPYCPSVPDI